MKRRTAVFIDGANIFYTQKKLGFSVDWKALIGLLEKQYELTEIKYYTGLKEGDEGMKKYLSSLRQFGIQTIAKPLKIIRNENLDVIYKSNCDVEMAVDILLDVEKFETLLLFSGDSDFAHLVKVLQAKFKKKAIIYSSRKTISWELKLVADKYCYLEDLEKKIRR